MPRNRIIYQSEALYAGPAPATGFHFISQGGAKTNDGTTAWINASGNLVKQLQRIQSVNYSFKVDRQDVNQFGQLAAIDRVILTNPTVSLDFSYLNGNLSNENILGFTIASGNTDSTQSAISGFLNKTSDERNYFIRTTPEGTDTVEYTDVTSGNNGVIGIGNATITSYSTEGKVGDFPTSTINVEGLNMNFQNGISGNYVPAVNPVNGLALSNYYQLPAATANAGIGSGSAISALRPGDITLTLKNSIVSGVDVTDMNIQSYSLKFDLGRTPIQRLGNKFAFTREIDFPLTVTLSVDAQVTTMNAGNLANLVVDDSATYDSAITIKSPSDSNLTMAKYLIKGCKLNSQTYSSDIGKNKTVSLEWSAQVGGPQDTTNGLFINGQF
jgi:hypothetical protein